LECLCLPTATPFRPSILMLRFGLARICGGDSGEEGLKQDGTSNVWVKLLEFWWLVVGGGVSYARSRHILNRIIFEWKLKQLAARNFNYLFKIFFFTLQLRLLAADSISTVSSFTKLPPELEIRVQKCKVISGDCWLAGWEWRVGGRLEVGIVGRLCFY